MESALVLVSLFGVLAAFTTALASGFGAGIWVFLRARRAKGQVPWLPTHRPAAPGDLHPATELLASLHEVVMGVVEAWNMTQARRGMNLEKLLSHPDFDASVEGVVAAARATKEELKPCLITAELLRESGGYLADSFEYDPEHLSSKKMDRVWERDSGGKMTWQRREVDHYEGTDHTFRAHVERLPEVFRQLDEARRHLSRPVSLPQLADQSIPVTILDEPDRLFLSRVVRSTARGPDQAALPPRVYLESWLHGKDVDAPILAMRARSEALLQRASEQLRSIQAEAEPLVHVHTDSRSHEGPRAHRRAHALAAELRTAGEDLEALETWIDDGVRQAQLIRHWARGERVIEGDQRYLQAALALYGHAFPDSPMALDIRTSDSTALFRAAIVGTLVSVAVGVLGVTLTFAVGGLITYVASLGL